MTGMGRAARRAGRADGPVLSCRPGLVAPAGPATVVMAGRALAGRGAIPDGP